MSRYIRTQENIGSKVKDEIVMVNVTQGNYYALNTVAASIWEIIETPHSVDEICAKLTNEYDIDDESCKDQVDSFINQLIKYKVIEKVV